MKCNGEAAGAFLMKAAIVALPWTLIPSVMLLVSGASGTWGRTYYVDSQNGADNNDGSSATAAWKSLSKVSSLSLQTGDTVKLKRGGVWTGQTMSLKGGGSEGNPAIVTAYGEGAMPKLGGVSGTCVSLNGNWIVAESLFVVNVKNSAFAMSGQHTMVRACEACTSGAAIQMSGQYGHVTQCYFHDLMMITNDQQPDNDNGAMAIWFTNSNQEVSFCRFERCMDESIDYEYDGGGVEVWAEGRDITDIYVHHNFAYWCAGFFEMGGRSQAVDRIKVAYNVLVDCFSLPFVFFNASGQYAIRTKNYTFDNNTCIVHSCPSQWKMWACLSLGNMDPAGTFNMRNNLFYLHNTDRILSGERNTSLMTNNLTYHPGTGYFEKLPASPTDIVGEDPMVVNFGTCKTRGAGGDDGDYRLREGSPAIDKGADLGYAVDIAGNPVPSGSAPDIGAYEFQSGTSAGMQLLATGAAAMPQCIVQRKFDSSMKRIVLILTRGNAAPEYLDLRGRVIGDAAVRTAVERSALR
ncbi:MAG: hypothetical protein JXA18_12980 [Chitinispirillaceae bacterium]|nr:hypothetical protein [Chitinispirillaceae bacterium]